MKNAIRIILLVLVLALLCIPFVDFGKPESTLEAMKQKAEDAGYYTFTNGNVLTAIKRAGFSVDIENADDPSWIVKLMPDDIYSIEMHYVGK